MESPSEQIKYFYKSDWYQEPPQIILGPNEAFYAIALWVDETLKSLPEAESAFMDNYTTRLKRINSDFALPRIGQLRSLLDTILLFGKLDVSAGVPIYQRAIFNKGLPFNKGEVFDELLGRADTPFAHRLSRSLIHYANDIDISDQQSAFYDALIQSMGCCEVQISVGMKSDIIDFVERKSDSQTGSGGSFLDLAYACHLSSLLRSLDSGLPFYTNTLIAPVWKQDQKVKRSCEILKIVWNDISWLPRPITFHEALQMSQDEHIVSLRAHLDLWRHHLDTGHIQDLEALSALIRGEVANFEGKSWASQVSRLVTYSGLPIGLAEMMLATGSVAGIGVSTLGALTQVISDRIDSRKRNHWLSIGKGSIGRQ